MGQLHQALAEIKTMAAEGLLDGAEALEMRREVIAAHREEIRRRGAEGRAELEAKRAITAMTVAGTRGGAGDAERLDLAAGLQRPSTSRGARALRPFCRDRGPGAQPGCTDTMLPLSAVSCWGLVCFLSSGSHSRRLLSQRSTMVRRMCLAPAPFHRMPTCRGPTHSLASRRLRRMPRS